MSTNEEPKKKVRKGTNVKVEKQEPIPSDVQVKKVYKKKTKVEEKKDVESKTPVANVIIEEAEKEKEKEKEQVTEEKKPNINDNAAENVDNEEVKLPPSMNFEELEKRIENMIIELRQEEMERDKILKQRQRYGYLIVQEFPSNKTSYVIGSKPFGKIWFNYQEMLEQYIAIMIDWQIDFENKEVLNSDRPRILKIEIF
jgi:hypothetical protein